MSGYGAALCPGSLLRAPIPPKDHSSILLVEKRHSTCSTAPWLSLTKAACARTFRSATSPASCQSPALASATRWSPWVARERWSQGSARRSSASTPRGSPSAHDPTRCSLRARLASTRAGPSGRWPEGHIHPRAPCGRRAYSVRIETVNRRMAALCAEHGVAVLDLKPELSTGGVCRPEMTDDGLHFSARANEAWIRPQGGRPRKETAF